MSNMHATGPATDSLADGAPQFTANGGDWDDIAAQIAARDEEDRLQHDRVVVNMGPIHPSTHGVLRLLLETDGETVTELRAGTGFLHTGIEKNMEYRTWVQGETFVTRMDYVAPFFQEVGYALAVEKLLGITDDVPEKATVARVVLMELNRIASHVVAIGSAGNEMGGTTLMTISFRCRENILRAFEMATGLRMNHAYVRPGGLAQDLPEGFTDFVRSVMPNIKNDLGELESLLMANPILKSRFVGIGEMSLAAAMAMGLTGPCVKAAGYPLDMRKLRPYCGYETYDFEVPVYDNSDCYNRLRVRFDECYQSLKIVSQALDRLDEIAARGDDPSNTVMVADPTIAWPARMAIATDGQGQSLEHVKEIMGTSMESLIHHFKLVTQGFRVPAGQVYQTVEHAKGVLGIQAVSDGGTRPYRVHFRDPSYSNLQSLAMMCEGGMIADVVASLSSIDPVLGGVDR
ncbi:MAG: NADH-quinone oxidoreductase subunit D [Actinomyces succiniciruminis]|uniref:NADH-quinone oxidoreductase subunit D n=3 Tax=Actinomycetaceae TaxID=2049 RepID=A0A1M4S0A8_9ACTO|nr:MULTISPECIES: NADH-quinone oxidoreductase subunit D [Actinomyces]MBE6474281.1 NADH-quinone oxidoreductase subunit D [Actinomyces succiniciruminis]MBM6978285.1 NADH-quinone oxidoreductase subunit D [Actinomyces succiniciruminis]RAX23883.1 NADH-quinone oxidoreductase subunit D [Actinomyces sp. Z3]CED90215.1 NADH-quinone oxidoreductase subunit D 1 [Actinomyces succiniciruminis]SHE25666.1 respiratory chain nadh dehydrogenase 49 kd subunit signature [Actinomyces glycerinitolerans]